VRYATFGFSDKPNLDEGTVWPVAFALKELTASDEVRIGELVKKAVSRGGSLALRVTAQPHTTLHQTAHDGEESGASAGNMRAASGMDRAYH